MEWVAGISGIPSGLNTYAYVEGNPLAYYDPTGEAFPAAIGWAYLRCYAACIAWVAAEQIMLPVPCLGADEIAAQCAVECLNPLNWVKGKWGKGTNVTKREGKRRKNRIPDKGEPNTVVENSAGTTRKKYGPDGNVQKEWNKGHGPKAPRNEQNDHIHDYKPNPRNPSGRGERMPGREPRPRDLNDMDLL